MAEKSFLIKCLTFGLLFGNFIKLINVNGLISVNQSPSRQQLVTWASERTFEDALAVANNHHGNPLPSLTASQALGARGHVLLQDFHLIDKLGSFVRERIPERIAHAKGAAAHGEFVITHDISKYTKAKFLNKIGQITPVFVRFSTSVGNSGSADTVVDHHGFATKFYTEDGNHDLVGLNVESFMVRDPMIFSDNVRSKQRNPVTNMLDPNALWDFTSLRPETTLHTLLLFSDIGRPDGYRKMNGFGIHTFKLVNETGGVVFCKFHWRTRQPGPALTHVEAKELAGSNPDYKTQDLYDAIERGQYPSWDLYIQVMTFEEAKHHPRNPFDVTRNWRKEDYPLIPVGRMTLNRNVKNYFAEVEQVAMVVSNMVPGIEPSPDRMLAARLFSYQDAQRYRLGSNFGQIPINRPIVRVTSYNRNGFACHSDNGGGSPNYYPNSFGGFEPDSEYAAQVSFSVEGVVDRFDVPEDEHVEARIFLERDVDSAQRIRMVAAIADSLKDARSEIRERTLQTIFYPVQKELGDEIRAATDKAVSEAMYTKAIKTTRCTWSDELNGVCK